MGVSIFSAPCLRVSTAKSTSGGSVGMIFGSVGASEGGNVLVAWLELGVADGRGGKEELSDRFWLLGVSCSSSLSTLGLGLFCP